MLSQVLKPKKRLGQVFLKNRRYLEKIIKELELKPKEVVIEIGPGTGSLTEILLENEVEIIAIEKDLSLYSFLKERFKNNPNLKIIKGDIRNILKNTKFQKTIAKQTSKSNFKLVGNIPYYLTSYLFRLLIDLEKKPKIIVLMVQKEVALRIKAKPPKTNLLAALLQLFFEIKIVDFVSKDNFWPKPKVNSAIIKLALKPEIFSSQNEKGKVIKVIKAGFSQPRKLLINNLSENLSLNKQKVKDIFNILKIAPNSRAQNLFTDDWQKIAENLL